MIQILANSKDSKSSVNQNNSTKVDLQNSYRLLPNEMFFGEVDINTLFEEEREYSDNYRLIVTINPILTNVLFNVNTEVVKFNEEKGIYDIVDERITGIKGAVDEDTGEEVKVIGDPNPNRIKMIQNTEYSKSAFGYEYYPGYDIFNNHIFRNVSFKSVNMLSDSATQEDRLNFNTIRDLMRYDDGDVVLYNRRISVDKQPEIGLNKHLYDAEDMLSIEDSINNNLMEENGWFGFTNGMRINTRRKDETVKNNTIYHETLDINKPMNYKNACDFIDMYPDRTLFSFVPKVNDHQKRLEFNWNYCLTYPYKSTTNHTLVYGNNVNGLKCQYIQKKKGFRGNDTYLFRMLLPHNLNEEDRFYLYVNGEKINYTFIVAGVGDLQNNDKKYIFFINGNQIEEQLDIKEEDFDDVNAFNEALNNGNEFRIRRVVGDFESEYYIRLFRKLPNYRYAKKLPTDTIVGVDENGNKQTIADEVIQDLIDRGKTDFDSQYYQLAYATNIYNDHSVQITFTDNVNINSIRDNLGRPLSEIYLTIVKNNKGWESWYGDGILPGVEPSGCTVSVSNVTCNDPDNPKRVPTSGGTFTFTVHAKTDIGDSIQWTASNGQSGNDGDNLVVTIPECTDEENPCVTTVTVTATSDEVSCGGGDNATCTIYFEQDAAEGESYQCTDCIPMLHSDDNLHSVEFGAGTVTITVFHSCADNVPNPWKISLVDRATGLAPTWAKASPTSGSGYCCPEWDCGPDPDGSKENSCVGSSPDKITITLEENETRKQRVLDFKVESTGKCVMSSSDYIAQNGNPNADECNPKYAMFRNSRTITGISKDGTTLKEPLNIYCKVGDVEPTFEIIDNIQGVSVTANGDESTIVIPKNTEYEAREILIYIHPNIDDVIASGNTNNLSTQNLFNVSINYLDESELGNKKKEVGSNKVYWRGQLFSDYTDEDEDDIIVSLEEDSNHVIQPVTWKEEVERKKGKKKTATNKLNKTGNINFVTRESTSSGNNSNTEPRVTSDSEYSHAFGKITSGFRLLQHLTLPDENGAQEMEMDANESDVRLLHNIPSYEQPTSVAVEDDITIDGAMSSKVTDEISNHNDVFVGDIVEFNKLDAKETVLDSVYHRFNTNQREYDFAEGNPSSTLSQFHWDEFISDDYDYDGFKVNETATTVDERTNLRPEGYYYKPHYRIPLREVSQRISQDSVMKIVPNKTEASGDGLMDIITEQKHHLLIGENVQLVKLNEEKKEIEEYVGNVNNVTNEIRFTLNYKDTGWDYGTLVSGLKNGEIELRRYNSNIPYYAFPLNNGTGTYVWRDINRIGNMLNVELLEADYPFTNNAFYHHTAINFYLRRQDPKNEMRMYCKAKFPNDVAGTPQPINNYRYENEEDILC